MHEPDAAVFTCEAAEQGGSAQQVGSAQQGGYMQQASYVQQSDYAQQGAGAAERLRAAGAGAATIPVGAAGGPERRALLLQPADGRGVLGPSAVGYWE